jgi:hypothetical protein
MIVKLSINPLYYLAWYLLLYCFGAYLRALIRTEQPK